MVEIEDKIVSEEVFEEMFSCDLSKCKGICCIEGDSGAPLKLEEIDIIEQELENIKPFMTKEGADAVQQKGVFDIDEDGDYTTTLVNGAECAFVVMEGDVALCAIEKAYRSEKSEFMKPISCHLYPIRVKEFKNGMHGLNYHRWEVCKSAVCNGEKSSVKVYECAKDGLIRAYGELFYEYMVDVDRILSNGEVEEE